MLKTYGAQALATLTVAIIIAALATKVDPKFNAIMPITAQDHSTVSAMILSQNKHSGGSGVIIQSSPGESFLLTNKHVCEVVQNGGWVKTHDAEVQVAAYKLYKKHDLCLIKVATDLGAGVILAPYDADLYSESDVAGHPALLPMILTKGHFTEKQDVNVMVGVKPCTGKESDEEALSCMFMGGVPILKTFPSQVVSSLIMPGSSGSGVFDSKGYLVALIFAGSSQGLSYGNIVPYKYLRDFLINQDKYKWNTPDPKAAPKNFLTEVLKFRDYCSTKATHKRCSNLVFQAIWRVK